jgi:hypothetical protein
MSPDKVAVFLTCLQVLRQSVPNATSVRCDGRLRDELEFVRDERLGPNTGA